MAFAFGALVVFGPAESAAAPCDPVARVDGAAETIEPVVDALSRLGVKARSSNACRATVAARVERKGEHLVVRVTSSTGAAASLEVTSARTAAAFIESYARPDLGAPLLRSMAMPPAPPPPPIASVDPAPPVAAAVTRAVPPKPRQTIRVITSVAVAEDDSQWRGLEISATWPVARFRLGLAGRYSRNAEVQYHDDLLSAERTGKEVIGVAQLPLRLGRATITPGAQLGLGWFTAKRNEPGIDGPWQDVYCVADLLDTGEGCMAGAPVFIGDGFATSRAHVLTGARVSASLPLGKGISLTAEASVDALLTADGDASLPPYAELIAGDPTFDTKYFELPAEPSRFFRLSLGAEVAF